MIPIGIGLFSIRDESECLCLCRGKLFFYKLDGSVLLACCLLHISCIFFLLLSISLHIIPYDPTSNLSRE